MTATDQDLTDKVYVVTGANSGIGFEAAKNFAGRGATLAMVCRNEERGNQALSSIEAVTGNRNSKLYLADFNSLASVNKLSQQLLTDFPVIDVLCNNAGGVNASRTETEEGFETTLVVNHLSTYLLTTQLLPAILTAARNSRARVVFTSSLGHKNSPLDFDDLNLRQHYSTLKAYGRSKLMNLLTAREIHRRFGTKNIIASSFHPGAVRTPIWNKGGVLARIVGIAMYPFMVDVQKGADTLIWLASSDEPESINAAGSYFYQRRQVGVAPFATDQAAQKLWQASEELIRPYLTAS